MSDVDRRHDDRVMADELVRTLKSRERGVDAQCAASVHSNKGSRQDCRIVHMYVSGNLSREKRFD